MYAHVIASQLPGEYPPHYSYWLNRAVHNSNHSIPGKSVRQGSLGQETDLSEVNLDGCVSTCL
ncbi:MAG TPA: hypothetical protein IGS53_00905 [Leptolyngbyaceae cyanobacterium M33_DOE_097]|uniref:Uncharacterized protein n=1 Tax=Oscillatoriales cyanobacterium SpSt-418 TaxID=2282169 RepID=A0A7C3PF91_9CYAN|nr:hypothetical protein [Leptolyngbyaceae cyanobacterium M33_DOE_097]